MKVTAKSFVLSAAAASLLIMSCGTTDSVQKASGEPEIEQEVVVETQPEEVAPEVPAEPTEYELYKNKIDGLSLRLVSAPKATTKGRAFTSPFSVKVTKSVDGTPAEGVELLAVYPVSRKGDEIQYGETKITSNGNGTANFTPPVPKIAVNGTVSIFPAGDISNEEIRAAAKLSEVTAAYQVRSNLLQSGGCIALVDYAQNGSPITNNSVSSSNLLTELMKKGFVRIGNIDFTKEVDSGDKATVYAAAKPMIGSSSSYLIFGTVKYEQVITQVEDGYSCTLVGDVTCMNMKDGSVLYHTTKSASALDAKDWNVLPKARAELAAQLAEAIYYGL